MFRHGKREPQVKRIAQANGVKNVLSSQEDPAVQFYWKESEQEPGGSCTGARRREICLGEFASQLICVVFVFVYVH